MSAASDSINAAFIKSAFEVKAQRDEALSALFDITDRFKAICMDADGNIDPADVRRIERARAIIRKAKIWK